MSNSQGHGNSRYPLKKRALAAMLSYRSRQEGIARLYGIQRTLPLPDGCCALYFGDNCVKDRDTLLNEPKELFECVKVAKFSTIYIQSRFKTWDHSSGHGNLSYS
jgi:hypothetical protein